MTKKTTKRALLSSLMAMLLCFTMLLGTTFAWFTDSVTSANNIIKSGNLDIVLEYWDGDSWEDVQGTSGILTNELWEPGATEVAYLRVANAGSLALKYQLGVNIASETEGVNAAGETFLLSDYIQFGVVEGLNGETDAYAADERADAIADAAANAKKISEGYADAQKLYPVDNDDTTVSELYLALVVYMPEEVGNVANHDGETIPEINLGIEVVATQVEAEFDSFGDDYDANAPMPTTVATAEELVAALATSGSYVLTSDIAVEEKISVPAGAEVVLDLNGCEITYSSTIQGENMITNTGNLTINDSVGTGVINYNYTGEADPTYGKGNSTISNQGTLTVNGGEITIAKLSNHAKYPIDNNSTAGDAVLVVNGGSLYNYNTSAIRQFCNSTTYKNDVTINGGLVEGYCAIWMQNPGAKTVNGSLTITGGEIRTTAKAYVEGTAALEDVSSAIYCTIAKVADGGAWSADSFVSITGGTFNENVALAEMAPAVTVGEGATFNGRLAK